MQTIREIANWQNRRVLLRTDLNVPLNDAGKITNDNRIVEALPTLTYLLSKGARVIVLSHLGRPKGWESKLSLKPVAEHLQALLPDYPVKLATAGVSSPETRMQAETLEPGQVLLLENIRFEPGEEKNDPALAQQLAALGDCYVNDAFGAAHRAHASTEGVTHFIQPCIAGLLMEKEVQALSSLIKNPQRPYTAIIGGSKISTKITVLNNLLKQVDTLVLGGAMVFTFLKAQGLCVGQSLHEPEYLETAQQLMAEAKVLNKTLILADDVVISDAQKQTAEIVSAQAIPEDKLGLDIGPKTIQTITQAVQASSLVLWNGPLGMFELPPFAQGTRAVADVLANWTSSHKGTSILGGGDTVAAIEAFGFTHEQFTHVSTGGGASLEFLEGKVLPGIAALERVKTQAC